RRASSGLEPRLAAALPDGRWVGSAPAYHEDTAKCRTESRKGTAVALRRQEEITHLPRPPTILSARPRKICSGQRAAAVVVALAHFRHRIAAFVLVFDVGRNRVFLALEQLQHFLDGRVPLAERHVLALIFLAILDVQRDNALVVLLDEGYRIVTRRPEVPDIQVHRDVLRQLHSFYEALGLGEFVGAFDVRVPVHAHHDLVFIGFSGGARRHRYRGRGRNRLDAQRLG